MVYCLEEGVTKSVLDRAKRTSVEGEALSVPPLPDWPRDTCEPTQKPRVLRRANIEYQKLDRDVAPEGIYTTRTGVLTP
jgi:hypothetical protein